MRAIAKFALRSPTLASINAATYALFALFFAPFMVVSGAVIALVTLRFGAAKGSHVFGVAMLFAGIAYYLLLHRPQAVVLLLVAWVPTLIAAQLLRATENQGLAVAVCAGFAAIYTTAVRLTIPDVAAHWLARLQMLGDAVRDQGGTFFDLGEMTVVAGIMHEATIVVACLYWMSAVLLARWWQAEIFNPGGFGTEFRQLVIPRRVSLIAAIVAALALMQLLGRGVHGLASDLLVALVVLFALQGLALLHHRVHKIGMARGWLVGFYVLLIIMPHRVGFILAFIGIADTLADVRGLRRRNLPVE